MFAMMKRVVPLCSVLAWCARKDRKQSQMAVSEMEQFKCPWVEDKLSSAWVVDATEFLYIEPKTKMFASIEVTCEHANKFMASRSISGSTSEAASSVGVELGLSGSSAVHGVKGGLDSAVGRTTGSEEEQYVDNDESRRAKFIATVQSRSAEDDVKDHDFSRDSYGDLFHAYGEFYISDTSTWGQGMKLMYWARSQKAISNTKVDLGVSGDGSKGEMDVSGAVNVGSTHEDSETGDTVNMNFIAVGGKVETWGMDDILMTKENFNQTLNGWRDSLTPRNSEPIDVTVIQLCSVVSDWNNKRKCEERLTTWWKKHEEITCFYSWVSKRWSAGTAYMGGRDQCAAYEEAKNKEGHTCDAREYYKSSEGKPWWGVVYWGHRWTCYFKIARGDHAGSSCHEHLSARPIRCCGGSSGQTPPQHTKTDYGVWGDLQVQKNMLTKWWAPPCN